MKPSSARVVGLLALMWSVSCGAPDVARPAAAPLAIGPAAPARPPSPPPPEPSPEAPADLALLVRINDGRQLLREIATILPPGAASAAATLDPGQLLAVLLGRRLGDVVDLGQPLDVTSLGTVSPSFVLSMAVKPEADGRLGEGLVLREEGGLVHITKPDDGYGAAGRFGACAFTPAAGRARTRLVCASDRASLESAAPYLARTVAAEPLEVDVRVTVPGRVLRERRESTTKALSDAASARLGDGLVESFLAELERVDVDLRFLGTDLELGVSMHLSARESMLARALVPGSKPAPPPAAFDRLPADALVALHTNGALPDDIAPLNKAVADNIEATLLRDGYGAAETRALRERFESLLLTGGPLVVGIGVTGGRDGAEQALARLVSPAPGPPPPPPKGTRATARRVGDAVLELQARKALQPWLLLEVDEPAEKWTRGLRELVRRAEDAERTRRPGSHASTPRDPDGDHVDLKVGTLDPALKLPKSSLHLEARITPRTKGKRPPRTAHVFVVPKGTATWIGYSEDATAIASRLRLALDDASDVGTLGRTAGASALGGRPALARGLVSLLGLRYLTLERTTTEELQRAALRTSRIAALGVRGAETVSWTATADTSPGAVGLSVRAQVTRQAAADLVRMLGL
jgi:hypothetical protein